MQVYFPNGTWDTSTIATLTGAGFDVAIPDDEMSSEDYQEAILASDVLLLHASHEPHFGFLVGLAMAFGKAVYAFDHVGGAMFDFESYHHYTDLEDALKDLLEDHDDTRLDGAQPGPGGDSEAGGNPSDGA